MIAYWNIFILILTFLILVWILVKDKKKSNKKGGNVPGPTPTDLQEGNLVDIRNAGSLHEYLDKLHRQWGPIVSFWIGKNNVVSIASAEMFKQHQQVFDRPVALFEMQAILIGPNSIQLKNGAEGRQLHKMLSRPFAFNECKKYYAGFLEIGKQLLDKLEALPASTPVPIWENMTVVAITGLLQAAFGHRLNDDKIALELNRNYEIAWHKIESFFKKSKGDEFNDEEIKNALSWYRKFARDLLETRKRENELPDEPLFVDVLLSASEDMDYLEDNAVTFITGGFHTTSCLLTWILYFLAVDEAVQEKVHSELIQVLGNDDITPETFRELKYVQQVIDESLRASTLAPYAARFSEKDTELGGYIIPANTPVLQALGVVLNDDSNWDSPEKFDPERFSSENTQARATLTFAPFGFAGKRICPGYRFAYVEVTIILSLILRRLKFRLVEGQEIHRVFGLVTKPSSEIWMTFEPRKLS